MVYTFAVQKKNPWVLCRALAAHHGVDVGPHAIQIIILEDDKIQLDWLYKQSKAKQAKQEVYCILQWKNREAQSTKTEVTFSEMGIRLISVDIPSWIGRDQKEPWLLFVAFSIAAQLCALYSLIYPNKQFCMRIFLKIASCGNFPRWAYWSFTLSNMKRLNLKDLTFA